MSAPRDGGGAHWPEGGPGAPGPSWLDDAVALRRAGRAFVIATVVSRRAPQSAPLGAKALLLPDGSMRGWVGGGCVRPTIVREAMAALEEGTPRLVRLDPNADDDPRPGLAVYPMTCQGEGSVDVYLEPVMAKPALFVLGRSPVAEALARLAATLDYAVTVVDPFAEPARFPEATVSADVAAVSAQADESAWIVVATMGEGDEEALEAATKSPARYIGLVASRKKGASLFAHLRQAAIPPERIAAIECPAGLDLGARTPPEIALTILAGMMKQRSEPNPTGPAVRSEAKPSEPAVHEAKPSEPPTPIAIARATASDMKVLRPLSAVDPVCGMPVDTPRHTAMHEGREYWFCCPHCRKAFLADPAKYVAATTP